MAQLPDTQPMGNLKITAASHAQLLDVGSKLSPGSNDALENDSLETTVWADLVKTP